MGMSHDETQSAIPAWVRFAIVQVDEDAWMSRGSAATITNSNSPVYLYGGDHGDELHGCLRNSCLLLFLVHSIILVDTSCARAEGEPSNGACDLRCHANTQHARCGGTA
jgi:hypothetical protein